MPAPLLRVREVTVTFQTTGRTVCAARNVHLSIYPRQTLAVVGESGCGKSVTALSILRLIPSPPGRIERGSIVFDGRDLLTLPRREMLQVRGRQIAMIFQEPMSSLNPVQTVGSQIVEAIRLHGAMARRAAWEHAAACMDAVGIQDARRRRRAYPHEFSGGMRQRAMIAMALACRPRLLLADEPTTALDVTTEAQILDLLGALQDEHDLAIMLITHDLGLVSHRADVVCVMHGGRVLEYARAATLFAEPLHPYTRALLAAAPRFAQRRRRLHTVREIVADPGQYQPLPGDAEGAVPWWPGMHGTPHATPEDAEPALLEVRPDHWVACRGDGGRALPVSAPPDIAPVAGAAGARPVAVG